MIRKAWIFAATILVALATTASAAIVCVPEPLVLSQATPTGAIVVTYTGGGSANLYGYSIDVVWDHTVATGVFSPPDNGPFAASAFFFVLDLGDGHVRVDAAIGGSDPGIVSGELFKAVFSSVGGQGTSTVVNLTIDELRDPLNQPIFDVEDDGLIFVDTGLPSVTDVAIANTTLAHTDDYLKNTDAVTVTATVIDGDPAFGVANIAADLTALGGGGAVNPDTYLASVATWTIASAVCTPADGELTVTVVATDNSANVAIGSDTIIADNTRPTPLTGMTATPGHEQIHLGWTDPDPTDLHVYGVLVRFAAWGDYPEYDWPEPAFPDTVVAGEFSLQVGTGVTAADWAREPRDIYYLAGFVYDIVLNYSSPDAGGASFARATNYWLGDVGPDGGDGYVTVNPDVHRLGDSYGLPDTDGDFDPECNVGPTDTASPRAIPLPNDDDEVGFEDLMIFALNFGVVSPLLDLVPSESPALAWRQIDETTWALVLERECAYLKGLNLSAALPAGVTCQVAAGDALASQPSPVFLRNIAARGLDAGLAVMGQGAGFVGSGELARVTFSAPVIVAPAVVARGLQNEDLSASVSGVTATPVPGAADLGQNYPNPFNPRTTIAYSVPADEHVRLVIYGVDGAMVRTLVDESRPAGRHTVVWDGFDDSGRPVASGTYMYAVQMGDFRQVRKMALMR